MTTRQIETDYLVVGAGTAGLAFADTLIAESDAHVTIVDREGKPGGHWNHAYSFVTLHQPSAYYGVNSMELCGGRIDTVGLNKGMQELASGPEISGYFNRVMNQVLLPSGRVSYHPLSNHGIEADGSHVFESLLSGVRTRVVVRKKVVDAHTYGPATIPATHTPRFRIDPRVRLVPPNALPGLWHTAQRAPLPRRFVVLGAGKTAIDTCLWLLQSGAEADAITWVVSRDPWLLNRAVQQNDPAFFDRTIGGQADQMEAIARARTVDELFLQLEAKGIMMRVDRERMPGMFHMAIATEADVAMLRELRQVVRMGRVHALEAERMVLDHGTVAIAPDTLFIDCTASAVEFRPSQALFQPDRIVLQMVRLAQPAFSAALTAYVEARHADDAEKNRLCRPVPLQDTPQGFPDSMLASMVNAYAWGQDKALRDWIRASRLDVFGKLAAGVARDDAPRQALLTRWKEQIGPAMKNLPELVASASRQMRQAPAS